MEPERRLYGWDDGKVYFLIDEEQRVCVTDNGPLLQKLVLICEEHYMEHPPGDRVADEQSFEPEMPGEVTSSQGVTYDLEEIASCMFDLEEGGEMIGLLNLENGLIVRHMPPDLVGEIDYPGFTDEEKQRLHQTGALPEGWEYIEQGPSQKSWRFMEKFARTIENPVPRDRLLNAIQGGGAFRRFRDITNSDKRMRERWFAFREDCRRRAALTQLVFVYEIDFPEEVQKLLQ
ncbi:MAG: UPF0158 family protein [Candidatus Brocadiia bacterium]